MNGRSPSLPAVVEAMLTRHGYAPDGDETHLVAVSGGMDSMVLLDIVRCLGYAVAIAHVNYQLRGQESDLDEQTVRQYATQHDVAVHALHLQRPPNVYNVQEWARDKRYNYFEKILDEYYYAAALTGHHADDNFETLLLHLIRGTGIRGLRGIPAVTQMPVLRPLLEVQREAIRAYAVDHGLVWREDSSNDGDAYQRNRIRHRLTPVLRDLGFTSTSGIATQRYLRAAERFYARGLQQAAAELLREEEDGSFGLRTDHPAYTTEDLLTVLHEFARHTAFTTDQWHFLLSRDAPYELIGEAFVARIDPPWLRILRRTEQVPPGEQTVTRLPGGVAWDGGHIEFASLPRPADLTPTASTYYLRLAALPLHLRSRKKGDRFRPLGMSGQKKVKDFLIDEKVPPWERDRVPVLTDAAGSILALVGLRIAEDARVRDGDTEVLMVRHTKAPDRSSDPGLSQV